MILMKIKGSKLLSNTWKQELIITDKGVEAETLKVGRRAKKSILYGQIAQVNLYNKILSTNIEIVNMGGADNIFVKAVDKKEALKGKSIIEQNILSLNNKGSTVSAATNDIPSQIKKLSDLKNQGIITEEEFTQKKAELLAKM